MIYLVTFMTKKSYKTAKKWAHGMALPVMEFQDQGYKIRKIFA